MHCSTTSHSYSYDSRQAKLTQQPKRVTRTPSFTAALKSRLAHVHRSDYHALVDDYASEFASTPTHPRTGTRQAAQGVDAR